MKALVENHYANLHKNPNRNCETDNLENEVCNLVTFTSPRV